MLKDSYNIFDALIYRKRGKYSYLDEQDDATDIFQAITGLKVSDGAVILTENRKGAIFVDGRYILAAKSYIYKNNRLLLKKDICENFVERIQNKTTAYFRADEYFNNESEAQNTAKILFQEKFNFEIHNYSLSSILEWIKNNISENQSIAYDPRFFSKEYIKTIHKNLKQYKFKHINIENILNIKKEKKPLQIHFIKATSSENRLSIVHRAIVQNNIEAYLISDPCTIAWLLNIRDFNSKYTPVVLGYLLVTNNYKYTIYVDEMYDKVEYIASSNIQIKIKSEKLIQKDIEKFINIGIDESETASYLNHKNFINIKNPCLTHKSIKNKIEIENIKSAAQKDSIAIINFLQWIYTHNKIFNKELTELMVVEKLLQFRKEQSDFICESFRCIAAADSNSAIVHYSPTEQSNTIINKILLIDSGGQYKDGTTDITRTICMKEPTIEQKKYYTLVLKGHIAVANAKMPIGSTGAQLDPLARQFLWQYFADYNHGTGHGIGYLSNVHEGPIAISKNNNIPLLAGMVISNEPGYYKDNEFGIRLENMLVIREENNFLTFETISLIPFDMNFIDKTILTLDEYNWINSYHKTIIDKMKEKLSNEVLSWLLKYCFI